MTGAVDGRIRALHSVLPGPSKQWFQAIVDSAIDDSKTKLEELQRQLRRYPSGYIRGALLPQIEAQQAFYAWLVDSRAALEK